MKVRPRRVAFESPGLWRDRGNRRVLRLIAGAQAKAALPANRSKHGVPLASGAVVIEHCIGQVLDERLDYGEVRVNAFGLVENRLFVCTYTIRNETYRIVSVRKASRQEQRTWLLL